MSEWEDGTTVSRLWQRVFRSLASGDVNLGNDGFIQLAPESSKSLVTQTFAVRSHVGIFPFGTGATTTSKPYYRRWWRNHLHLNVNRRHQQSTAESDDVVTKRRELSVHSANAPKTSMGPKCTSAQGQQGTCSKHHFTHPRPDIVVHVTNTALRCGRLLWAEA